MAINLRDYSRTAAQRGWGGGWPSCAGAKAAGTAVVTAEVSGTRMSVHKRIARLVDLLIDTTERRGYRLRAGQCGGYNCRAIGGTSSPSNHSWALAVDLNWQANPMKRPLTTDIPAWMVQLWGRYGFAWGGHYSGTPDSMHFEFMGGPGDADAMTALAVRELAGQPAPATPNIEEDSLATVPQEQWAKVYRQESATLDYRNHHGQPTDDQLGHTLSTRLELNRRFDQLMAALAELTARIAKIEGTK